MGSVHSPLKRSPSFMSNVPRKSYTAAPPPSRRSLNPRDDCFLLKSEDRKERTARDGFNEKFQLRVGYGFLPLQKPYGAPTW